MLFGFGRLRRWHNALPTIIAVVVLLSFMGPPSAHALSVAPVTPEEVLAVSDSIFVGSVTSSTTRWSNAHKNMVATDYQIRLDRIVQLGRDSKVAGRSAGDVVTLSFAGGEVDGLRVDVPGLPQFVAGDQAVFMLRDADATAFSPLTGASLGLYRFVPDKKSGKLIAAHQPGCAALTPVRRSFFSEDVDRLEGFTVDEFVAELERALVIARKKPELKRWVEPTVVAPELRGKVMTGDDIPTITPDLYPAPPPAGEPSTSAPAVDSTEPPAPGGHSQVLPSGDLQEATEGKISTVNSGEDTGSLRETRYGWTGRAVPDAPYSWNIPPDYYLNGSTWGANYEYSLSDWNRYASGVFTKRTNSENSFGNNSRNDFAFATSAQLNNIYSYTWPSGGLGVCFTYSSSNKIVQSDVFLNPAKAWTNDFEYAYSVSSTYLFRSVAVHEIGHAFGRNHSFQENHQGTWNSVMNYHSSNHHRSLAMRPFMDDAESIRAAYPSRTVSMTDIGIFLFRTNGTGNTDTGIVPTTDAVYPTSIPAGSPFSVSGFVVENIGTVASSSSVTFYLTPSRFSWDGLRNLGSASYGSLGRFSHLFPTFNGTVPINTPPGTYYLGVYLDTPSDSFNSNRAAWAKNAITVTAPRTISLSPTTLSRTVTQGQNAAAQTFGIRNSGTGTLSYSITDNVGWLSCTPASGTSAGEWDTITVSYATALLTPGTHTATITATGANTVNSPQTVIVTLNVVPVNDDFANRSAITSTASGSNVNATIQSGEPQHRPGIVPGKSVWWKYTPNWNGTLTVDTIGSGFDTVLAVYSGSSLGTLTQLGSDDDSGGNQTSRITNISVKAGTEYKIAVDGYRYSGGTYAQGNVALKTSLIAHPYQPTVLNEFANGNGWGPTGSNTATYSTSHSVAYNALLATVSAGASNRIPGWLENQAAGDDLANSHLKYSNINSNQHVRAKFHIFATGQTDPTNKRQVPNIRLRVSSRFAFASLLEVFHHNSDAGGTSFSRDLVPSNIPEKPSVYRVDLDPPELPYLVGNTTEGIQRMFEAYSTAGEPQANGSLALTESSIGRYPAPNTASTDPSVLIKTYSTEADFAQIYYDLRQLERGTLTLKAMNANGNNSGGSFGGVTWTGIPEAQASVVPNPGGVPGVRLSTAGTADSLIAVAAVDWLEGNAADANHTLRARLEENKQYAIRFYATASGASSNNALLRFRVRTAKFNISQRLEVGGAWNLSTWNSGTNSPTKNPSTVSHILARQYLPGTGGWMAGNPAGAIYDVLMPTLLSKDIRPEVEGTIQQRMPNLATEDGPGQGPATRSIGSRRDIYPGVDIIDSLGGSYWFAGSHDPGEKGNVRISRIEIRKFDLIAD